MENIEIKRVSLDDVETLQSISKQTFFETFSESNTEANMGKYLAEVFSIKKLTTELTDDNSEFYFAVQGNDAIGYLKLNLGPSQTELKSDKSLEIERIYVRKQFHGKKIGQLLFDKALEIAYQCKADYVWLGVWEENPRAINFYQKNGFVQFDKHIFRLGDDDQTDIMMKKIL